MGVTSIRVLGAIVAFFSNVLINKYVDISSAGQYYLAITMVTFLGVFFNFGVPSILMRNAAYCRGTSIAQKHIKKYITLFILSILLLLIFITLSWGVTLDFTEYRYLNKVKLEFCAAVICTILIAYLSSFAHGLGLIKTYSVLTTLSIPLIFCILVFWLNPSNVGYLLTTYSISLVLSSVIGIYLLLKIPRETNKQKKVTEQYDLGNMNGRNDFWITNVAGAMNSGGLILISSYLLVSSDIAIISVSNRVVIMITFVMSAFQVVVAPKIANLYANGKVTELVSYYRKSTLLLIVICFPILIFVITFSSYILSFFGTEYVSGKNTLIILSIAQFINVSCGSVWTLLNLTGNHKVVRKISLFATGVGLLICPFLAVEFGAEGVALTTVISISIGNLIPLYYANKEFGVFNWRSQRR